MEVVYLLGVTIDPKAIRIAYYEKQQVNFVPSDV